MPMGGGGGGKGKDGKAKGKGKDDKGKGKQDPNKSPRSDKGSGKGGKGGKGGTDSPRGSGNPAGLPVEKQICIKNLFGVCKAGDQCKRRHAMKCPRPIFEHATFQKLMKEHGPPKNVVLPAAKAEAAGGAQKAS